MALTRRTNVALPKIHKCVECNKDIEEGRCVSARNNGFWKALYTWCNGCFSKGMCNDKENFYKKYKRN